MSPYAHGFACITAGDVNETAPAAATARPHSADGTDFDALHSCASIRNDTQSCSLSLWSSHEIFNHVLEWNPWLFAGPGNSHNTFNALLLDHDHLHPNQAISTDSSSNNEILGYITQDHVGNDVRSGHFGNELGQSSGSSLVMEYRGCFDFPCSPSPASADEVMVMDGGLVFSRADLLTSVQGDKKPGRNGKALLEREKDSQTRLVGSSQIKASSESRRRRAPTFACIFPKCNGRFTSLTNGKRHVAAHYNVRPFICSCDVRVTTYSDLKRHIRIRGARGEDHYDTSHLLSNQDRAKVKEAIMNYLRQIMDNGNLLPLKDVHHDLLIRTV